MNISKNMVIRDDMIFLNEEINSKKDALDFLTKKAEQIGVVTEQKKFLDSVLEREDMVSTAVGYQIAMPHGKSHVVNQPFVGFLRTTKQFDWSSDEDMSVNMIFLIGVPSENKDNIHLKVISQLSKNLLDDSLRDQLKHLNSIDEIYALLNSVNQSL